MSTPAHSDLAFILTKYYFDENVACVIKTLFNHDQASLRTLKINSSPQTKISDLKKSLLILIKYQLVDYVKTVKNFRQLYEYSIIPQRVFSFFRIARFIQMIGGKIGAEAQTIVYLATEKALIERERLNQLSIEKLRKIHLKDYDEEKLIAQINLVTERLLAEQYLVQTSKNLCVNFERFNRELRDELVIDTIYKFYHNNDKIKALTKVILTTTRDNTAEDAPLTAPIPLLDLISKLVPQHFKDKSHLESFLNKLTLEANFKFFMLSGGHHTVKGAMYSVNVGLVIDRLVKEHLSSVITTRFGPKCSRVFKVLVLRGPLLLKQIEEIIMLPARDVREYSYMLMREGFLRNRQVPKTPDNAPGKSVFVMSVDLDQVVFSIADLSCRSMNNLVIRYEYELNKNRSLLNKSKEFNNLQIAQDEWSQYFTSHELTQLEKTNRILNQLLLAKTQADETLFLMHIWLKLRPNLEIEFNV